MQADFYLENLRIHVLRDDLLNDAGVLSGNKARKLHALMRLNLPYNLLISYGSAQSNAAAALARFAKLTNRHLVFFAARSAPICGNLKSVLDDGAEVIFASELAGFSTSELDRFLTHLAAKNDLDFKSNNAATNTKTIPTHQAEQFSQPSQKADSRISNLSSKMTNDTMRTRDFSDFASRLSGLQLSPSAKFCLAKKPTLHPKSLALALHKICKNSFFIPEGAAIYEARFGARAQAEDLRQLAAARALAPHHTAVVLGAGTGTSALFLAQAAAEFCVFSYPCVSELAIAELAAQLGVKPPLWLLKTPKKQRFGALNATQALIRQRANKLSGLHFELLYDAPTLTALAHNAPALLAKGIKDIIYVHQGGALGDESMQERYKQMLSELSS